jgi:hypothetical protein
MNEKLQEMQKELEQAIRAREEYLGQANFCAGTIAALQKSIALFRSLDIAPDDTEEPTDGEDSP